MPFKNQRTNRKYHRDYMRKLRASQKGLTIKPEKLNPVKPINVKPKVKPEFCPTCQELKTALNTITQSYENLRQTFNQQQEQKREYWRQQKRRQNERKKPLTKKI